MIAPSYNQSEHDSRACAAALGAIEDTLYVLGGKWKLKVVVALRQMGVMRFNELQRLITGISPRMLSAELKTFELNGLVVKIVDENTPVAVQYELTPYGHSLDELLKIMVDWGQHHKSKVRAGSKNIIAS